MVIVALSDRGTLHLRTDSAQFRFAEVSLQGRKEMSDKLTAS